MRREGRGNANRPFHGCRPDRLEVRITLNEINDDLVVETSALSRGRQGHIEIAGRRIYVDEAGRGLVDVDRHRVGGEDEFDSRDPVARDLQLTIENVRCPGCDVFNVARA